MGLTGDTPASVYETGKWFNANHLYNIGWHTLGLSAGVTKNASEFERNAEQYGYTFTSHNTWKNEHWTNESATAFVRTKLGPLNGPFNAKHGSWKIMQLKQMGYTHEDFQKKNNRLWKLDEQIIRGQAFIDQYVAKVLAL